jgi:hypothetical protein
MGCSKYRYFNIIHFSTLIETLFFLKKLIETLNTLNIERSERTLNGSKYREKKSICSFTLQLFFLTSKPRGPAVFSIFEIISFAEHLDVNLVSLLTSPYLQQYTTIFNHATYNQQVEIHKVNKVKYKEMRYI